MARLCIERNTLYCVHVVDRPDMTDGLNRKAIVGLNGPASRFAPGCGPAVEPDYTGVGALGYGLQDCFAVGLGSRGGPQSFFLPGCEP